MIPEINYWAVVLATASSMLVGSIWYMPKVFGNRWARLANVDISGSSKGVVWPILTTLIVSFVTAWVLAGASAIAWHFYEGSFFVASVVTSILLWAGFTAARFITHDAFEGRPTALTTLNIAHELVTLVIMAVIIGAWAPAGTI
ncbi:MAG TPA: DUF1761 domain-containing protein [Microbacterium sp.]|nr:DUF1761 domain-containing protein [Microbacterium sp.]